MWKAIQEFFLRIFTGRTPTDSAKLKVYARAIESAKRLQAQENGMIVCPWCAPISDDTITCAFSHKPPLYRCSRCNRNGNLATLVTRLESPGVYEEPVE
jgi:transposase-like protein